MATKARTENRRPSGPVARPSANVIDPVRVIRQNLLLLMGTGVVGLVLGVGVFLVWDRFFPVYQGRVMFELAAELTSPDEASAREQRNEDTVERLAQSESQKAVGEDVLDKVLRVKDIQRTDWAQAFIDSDGNFNHDEAFVELDKEIFASHMRGTQFFAIFWKAKSAADIPVMLNEVAKIYFDVRKNARAGKLNNARSVFATMRDVLEDEIALAQSDIDEFIRNHDITNLDQGATALSRDLEATTLKLNDTKQELGMAQSRKSQVEAKLLGRLEPSQDDVLQGEQDPIVMRVLGQIQEISVELAHAREKFSSEHPHVQNINKRYQAAVRTKEDKIDEVIQRNLNGELKMLTDQIESLGTLEGKLEEDIETMAVRLEESTSYYAELTQKQEVLSRLRARLDNFEETQLEIQAMKDRDDAEKVVLIQEASKPREKAWPKWYVVIPGTAIALFGLVLGVVFLREFLDKRIRYASDVIGLPGARLLGMIPDLSDEPTEAARAELVVRDHPESVLAESYRQCQATIARSLSESDIRSLMVVGGMPEAGTTTVVVNLAMTALASGRRVAVIDANFRRPRLGDLLGLEEGCLGLSDVITNSCSLEDALVRSEDGLLVLSAGTPEHRVFEKLNTEAISKVLEKVGEQADLVLIDVPPLIVAGEGLSISGCVDGSLLVTRAYNEHKGLVARLIRQLSEQSSTFIGVMLNRPRNTAGGYFRRNFEVMASYSREEGQKKT
ncbi:MAG: hypothetical protein MK085_03160 [Phycisphaerales bacterium]|nr:hypothetical protein [Phycisphaerales bacterium]